MGRSPTIGNLTSDLRRRRQVHPFFLCEAGLIDWAEIWKLRFRHMWDLFGSPTDFPPAIDAGIDAFIRQLAETGYIANGAHLRWSTAPVFGLPSRAFKVWRRPRLPFEAEREIPRDKMTITGLPSGAVAVSWRGPRAAARIQCTVPAPGGVAIAYTGSPALRGWSTIRTLSAGANVVSIAAPFMTGVLLPGGTTVDTVHAITGDAAARDEAWKLAEIVGLPVEPADWAGAGDHDADQGLPDLGLVAPKDAALARFARGRPLLGWPLLMAPFTPAPVFQMTDPALLINEMEADIVVRLRALMGTRPNRMANVRTDVSMPPPENSAGEVAPMRPTEATFSALELLLLGVTSDPLLSLILGYGTALDNRADVTTAAPLLSDFMVTAEWDRGLDGRSQPLELAALALQPQPAFAGAAPMGLDAVPSMPMAPPEPDGDWRRSVNIGWNRVPKTALYRVSSYAASRFPILPLAAPLLLNETRDAGGIRPIATNDSPDEDAATARLSTSDRVVPIPAPALPTQNGFQTIRYGVVTQTIFGLWGDWSTVDTVVSEPAPNRVPILAAALVPQAVSAGACPATLTVEFGWDWSVRRPQSILIGGRLWAASKRSDPSPSELPTPQLPRSLVGAEPGVEITFAGDVPMAAGATIVGLAADGQSFADFGPAQGDDVRRYRMTLSGFALDFDSTPHVGLALYARATERRAPGRIGPWTEQPFRTAASDPRAPVIVLDHVDLASLPDARGEAHARVTWPFVAGAAGYYLYEASETALRDALGLPEPDLDATLTVRLAAVQSAYNANPVRRVFTRRFPGLQSGLSRDVALPRGSRDIHFFTVVAQNQSGLESPWYAGPDAGERLIAITPPRIARPEPPVLEVRRVPVPGANPPAWRAAIRVTPRLGHRARRIRLFRTRNADAARRIDSMGAPIAEITPSSPGWTLTTATDVIGDFITEAEGFDLPEGSWRRVWYRAEVWSGNDRDRGLLASRSETSPALHVVIPPASAPNLSVVSNEWPGGEPGNVLLSWTSSAPVEATPLGPHHMAISARLSGRQFPMLEDERQLVAMPPGPPIGVTAWWRQGAPAADGVQEYRAMLFREDEADPLGVAIRLRDPMGRITERLLTVPGGSVAPPPVITGLAQVTLRPGVRGAAWASAVPAFAGPGGAYRFTIIATQAAPPGPGGPTALSGSTADAARPALGTTIGGPGIRTGDLGTPTRALRLDIDVPDVPLRRAAPTTAPEDALVIWRLPTRGRGTGFGVATAADFSRIDIRLTAPDGRVAEASLEVR